MSRLTINSNIPSLNAQRNLGNASRSLETSFTRLSSGLRINKASDDAAGLSISESLKADTRIFNQGVRNLNDGLSLLSIADGALNELTNIVTRLSELAEQSANGTLGNKQRLSLDQEAQSLSKEYNRIARSTEFNGRKIFNGDFGELSLAAGGNASSLITDGLGGAIGDGTLNSGVTYSASVGSRETNLDDFNGDGILDIVSSSNNSASVGIFLGRGDGRFSSEVTYVGNTGGVVWDVDSGDFNGDGKKDLAIGASFGGFLLLGNGDGSFSQQRQITGVTPELRSVQVVDLNNDGKNDIVFAAMSGSVVTSIGNGDGSFKSNTSYVSGNGTSDLTTGDFDMDGNIDVVSANIFDGSIGIYRGLGNGNLSNEFRIYAGGSGVEKGDFDKDGNLDLAISNDSGTIRILFNNGNGTFKKDVSYGVSSSAYGIDLGDFNGDGNLDILTVLGSTPSFQMLLGNSNGTFSIASSYVSSSGLTSLSIYDVNADGASDVISSNSTSNNFGILLGNSNQGVSALQSFSLKTQQDSRDSITYLRQTLNRLSNQRGEIGAFQSRVETGVSNLQQSSLAYSEANSRITDIDVAEESSRLTATRILQQSATSVLAQANQQPRLVLQLLSDL